MNQEPGKSGPQDGQPQPDPRYQPTQAWQEPQNPPAEQPPRPGAGPGVHYAPTQAWQGPQPGPGGQQLPPGPGVHYAPTQAWQGPQNPRPTPPPPPTGAPPPQAGGQPGPAGAAGPPWGGGRAPHPGQQFPPQPGASIPPSGGWPMPAPPRPGGGNRGALLGGLIAGIVMIALIAGVLIYVANGDDSPPKPKADAVQLVSDTFDPATDRVKLWDADAEPGSGGSDSYTTTGQWLYDKTLVAGEKTLVGYDLKTGQRLWAVNPPSSGLTPCTMSTELTKGGVGAVLYTSDSSPSTTSACDWVQAVDAATGEEKWHAELKVRENSRTSASLLVNEDQVVAMTNNVITAYDIDTGAEKWSGDAGQSCYRYGKGEGKTLILVDSCPYNREPQNQVLSVDSTNGRILWKTKIDDSAFLRAAVLSANPPVVQINPGTAASRGYIVSFDENGTPRGQIKQEQSYGTLLEGDTFPAQYLIKDRTLVTTIYKQSFNPYKGGTVIAFDLISGAERWHSDIGTDKPIRLVDIAGESVIAIQSGQISTDQVQLLSYGLSAGTVTPGGKFPDQGSNSFQNCTVRMYGGLLVSVVRYTSEYVPWVALYAPSG